MAVTCILDDKFRKKLLTLVNPIDFAADDLRIALVTSAWTPNRATDEFWSTPQAHEVAAGGAYATDGVSLTTKVIGIDSTGHYAVLTADNVTWVASTITARYGVLYKKAGSAATSPLIGYVDFGGDEVTVSADFVLTWAVASAGGIVRI
jgi:hypothetical protein